MNQNLSENTDVQNLQMRALTDEEIGLISGGNPALVIAAAVTASFAALSAAEAFGEKLGKALYYATH